MSIWTILAGGVLAVGVVVAARSLRRSLRDERVREQQVLSRAYQRHGGAP